MSNLAEIVRDAVDSIDAFEAKCEREEYTDTGDVWELLADLREQLAFALGDRPQT